MTPIYYTLLTVPPFTFHCALCPPSLIDGGMYSSRFLLIDLGDIFLGGSESNESTEAALSVLWLFCCPVRVGDRENTSLGILLVIPDHRSWV
jgi:hypothetical protein